LADGKKRHFKSAPSLQLITGDCYAEIIRGVKNGEQTAASKFYSIFGSKINGLVWKLLGADQEHDDVVNQVFVNILDSLESLKDTRKLEAWVVGVTVNTIRRELRSRKIRRLIHLLPDTEDLLKGNDDCSKEEIVRSFYQVMDRMRPEERLAFGLYYVEGYNIEEVAYYLDRSLGTVKRRLKRARTLFIKYALPNPAIAALAEK